MYETYQGIFAANNAKRRLIETATRFFEQSVQQQRRPEPRRKRPKTRPAEARDAAALKLARQWDEDGRHWTLTELAAALDCDRSQLTGRTSREGPPRCPLFCLYWQARQSERDDRRNNLRKTNRTKSAEDVQDHEV